MLGFLKGWIINIVGLVLFLVLVEMLMPSGRMKRYASLVTGLILIIAIINPFVQYFAKGFKFEDFSASNSITLDQAEIEKDSKLLKKAQMQQIVEVYRNKLINRLELSVAEINGVAGVKADVIINEDFNSEQFGEIKRVFLEIAPEADNSPTKTVMKVEQVKIGNTAEHSKKEDGVEPVLMKKLEEKMKSVFDIQKSSLVISLKKG